MSHRCSSHVPLSSEQITEPLLGPINQSSNNVKAILNKKLKDVAIEKQHRKITTVISLVVLYKLHMETAVNN